MYSWMPAHFDGAMFQREVKQGLLFAAGTLSLVTLGAAYAGWKLVKTTRSK